MTLEEKHDKIFSIFEEERNKAEKKYLRSVQLLEQWYNNEKERLINESNS